MGASDGDREEDATSHPKSLRATHNLIETLLDMNDPMIEEVTRRLHNVEQRKKNIGSAIEK